MMEIYKSVEVVLSTFQFDGDFFLVLASGFVAWTLGAVRIGIALGRRDYQYRDFQKNGLFPKPGNGKESAP